MTTCRAGILPAIPDQMQAVGMVMPTLRRP
ncbi:hypothetical protein SAMN05421539_11157 [Jannaschia seohaensis]|uniref:Uncharacterized protein n=1 Tax=Jannaschia seohaensis TaxID=475081 RepID=A0A2Y9B6N7_9RHOB|nr:hypothetical protein BCF38_11157 [Jannaschia seohaensis]SSA49889.1 hypothetical protein SAMN05421539_11157 [Jannaschia seohaensis]